MHSKYDLDQNPKGKVKPKIDKGGAPQVKHSKALEQMDGGGYQDSEHPAKRQPKVMRHLRR